MKKAAEQARIDLDLENQVEAEAEPSPGYQVGMADEIQAETEQVSMSEVMAQAAPTLSGFDTASAPDEVVTQVMVSITNKEYLQLLDDSLLLGCLIGAGVNNWDGYDEAKEAVEAMKNS